MLDFVQMSKQGRPFDIGNPGKVGIHSRQSCYTLSTLIMDFEHYPQPKL